MNRMLRHINRKKVEKLAFEPEGTGVGGYKASKAYGLSRSIIDSISLFIYRKQYPKDTSPVTIFNEWAVQSGYKAGDVYTLICIMEQIRMIALLDERVLGIALMYDGLLN